MVGIKMSAAALQDLQGPSLLMGATTNCDGWLEFCYHVTGFEPRTRGKIDFLSNKKVPAARVLSSPSGGAAEDNVVD